MEHSAKFRDTVLTMLWWKDEAQMAHYNERN
jgi:hypothetical protein